MKSKGLLHGPQLKHRSDAQRRARVRAAASSAATLLCLAAVCFTITNPSAGAGMRQKKADPQASPVPPGATVKTTTTTTTTTAVTTPTPTPSPTPKPPPPPPTAGQRVKLYYLREGAAIAQALTAMAAPEGSQTHGLVVAAVAPDEVVLVGTREQRRAATRIIAALDLPRPGVQMEMWGVQLSSREPEELAEVMQQVRAEIDKTQKAVRQMYEALQGIARTIPDDNPRTPPTPYDMDSQFQHILVQSLYYESALDPHRPLSISDILLRLIAAEDPALATAELANRLDYWLAKNQPRYVNPEPDPDPPGCEPKRKKKSKCVQTPPPRPHPFERFFTNRGLELDGSQWVKAGTASNVSDDMRPSQAAKREAVEENGRIGKVALLNFALHYGRLVHDPEQFDGYYLQQAAGTLNTRLQSAIDALNDDIEALYVVPTLDRIRRIVARFKDVQYAQVGRTTVASLSGASTIVSSKSVNTFESTRPLSLSDFLTGAKGLTDAANPLVPNNTTTNKLGTIPFAEVLGLVGALGQDRSVWRELTSGVSFTITPNVLRDMASAELQVQLETGDPQAAGTQQAGVTPLSRVSQHNVSTKVYVNALDFFDLSAFASQATLTGGRGYVPILGPFWRGLFGDAPVLAELFSWKKPPKTVFSQSLVLTTSFVTPTAMGVALLVPTDASDKSDRVVYRQCFDEMQDRIDAYKEGIFGTPRPPEVTRRINAAIRAAEACATDAGARAATQAEADKLGAEAKELKAEAEQLDAEPGKRGEVEQMRQKVEAGRRAVGRGPTPTPTP